MRRVRSDDKTLAANLWPLCTWACTLLHTPGMHDIIPMSTHSISVFKMRLFLRLKSVEVIVIVCQYLRGLGVHEADAPFSGMWISVSEGDEPLD